MYEIVEIEEQGSGFYVCRVKISESDSIFLKFSENPNQEQVDYEVTRYLENLNAITE
jgi:hypothetical protein